MQALTPLQALAPLQALDQGPEVGVWLAVQKDQDEVSVEDQAVALWLSDSDSEEGRQDLEALGFDNAETSWHLLHELKTSRDVLHLQAVGRERLDKLMPLLLNASAQQPDPDLTLRRVLPLVEAIIRRSAYIALLVENPKALERLALLCGASPFAQATAGLGLGLGVGCLSLSLS